MLCYTFNCFDYTQFDVAFHDTTLGGPFIPFLGYESVRIGLLKLSFLHMVH